MNSVLLLCAGLGTRLRPLTDHTPKPLIPLHGRPLVDYTMERLSQQGHTHCVMNAHYLADQIDTYACSQPHGMTVTLSHEPQILGSGGGIRQASQYFKDPFFVINGDIHWTETDGSVLTSLKEAWDPDTMDAIVLLVPRSKAQGYEGPGDCFLDYLGRVSFREKEETAPFVFSGIYFLNPTIFEGEERTTFSIIDTFEALSNQGRLQGIVHRDTWRDLGTIESLNQLQQAQGTNEELLHLPIKSI